MLLKTSILKLDFDFFFSETAKSLLSYQNTFYNLD